MAILGLQDTGSFSSVRETNWRRAILLAFPNGSAPLTALLTLTKPEESDDPKFNWFQKLMPTQRSVATGAYASDGTTITVTDAVFRPGHIIKNLTESHGEVMKVVDVSADGLTLTVLRGNWGTAYASSGAADVIGIIGNSNSEASGAPTTLSYDPTAYYNYTQIFKTPFDLSGTALKTAVRYDPSGPWPEKMREALNIHSIELEKAFLKGVRAEYTNNDTGYKERTTGGVESFVDSDNIINIATGNNFGEGNAASTLTYDVIEDCMEQVFRVCLNNAQEKLALCGSGFMKVFNKVAKKNATINLVPKAEAFGMKIWEYTSGHGTLYLKTHPLFSQISEWRNDCLILDLPGLKYRYLTGRDTTRQKNIQANDADARKDQYLTEAGLEVHHGTAHMIVKGATIAGT